MISETAVRNAYINRDDVVFDGFVQQSLTRQEELETALLLTVSWLKKFQDQFDKYGDVEYGTFAYGHRQHIESVLSKPASTNEPI